MKSRRRLAMLLDESIPCGPQVRFIVVDDHRLFYEGLRVLAARERELALVGAAHDTTAALEVVAVHPCEVVVVDVSLPGIGGLALVRELKRRAPVRPVLMLSMHDEPAIVAASFASGADGYALKSQSPPELFEAIRRVASGDHYLAPALEGRVAEPGRLMLGHRSLLH